MIDEDCEAISKEKLNKLLGDKYSLSYFLQFENQYYLPEYWNTDFIKKVFVNQKKLYKLSEVKYISFPKCPDLSIKTLWEKYKQDTNFAKYFPVYPKQRLPDHSYFWNILNTQKPLMCKKIIKKILKTRADRGKNENDVIQVKPNFITELTESVVLSKKKGKVAGLLSQASQPRKPKRQYKKIKFEEEFKE